MSQTDKKFGTIKFFADVKGYGFIIPSDGGGEDVFFHIKQVKNGKAAPPQKDDKVSYVLVQGKRGLEAGDVQVIA